MEYDNTKDRARYKRYADFTREPHPWWQKMEKEGIVKTSGWADNTGHIVNWLEFENMEAFAKLWADEEYRKWVLEFNPLVDNLRFRLLRPSVSIPEELT